MASPHRPSLPPPPPHHPSQSSHTRTASAASESQHTLLTHALGDCGWFHQLFSVAKHQVALSFVASLALLSSLGSRCMAVADFLCIAMAAIKSLSVLFCGFLWSPVVICAHQRSPVPSHSCLSALTFAHLHSSVILRAHQCLPLCSSMLCAHQCLPLRTCDHLQYTALICAHLCLYVTIKLS